ncbi:AAA family ATPase [Turicibacter sanguinis]|uniref:Nuclease SbcCD subunit C n=2 Tax=Turicibacter sanguinis TaxID=154288 RepID=A0A9X5ANS6_9FIRM|nr:AAA family ATPase [Turicibacter sanguinis]EFF63358.1 putative DNA sulfur modification protein DndD [Turicibacter sanguinis PC909]MTK20940.1 AAA family ATPase [Turicibacter sanguinis]MTK73553.1 AAA family ATPase [Turicibacter sanguinis]
MKFKSINIINFRQFSGENLLEFSVNDEKNLTIIHAMNGSGKTTLLQAFNWCLYGKMKLPDPDKIINETIFQQLEKHSSLPVSVIVVASHEGIEYTIDRTRRVSKLIDGTAKTFSETFKISYIDSQGNSKVETMESAENIINNILPEKMSAYFLFDGERIKNLGENSAQARKDISTGIKNILNIDVYDSLKVILERKLMPLLHSQIKSEGSEKLDTAINARSLILQQLDRNEITVKQLSKDIDELSEDIEKLNHQISLNADAFEIQEQYKQKNQHFESLTEDLNDLLYPGKKTSKPSFPKTYTKYTITKLLSLIKDDVILNLDTSNISKEAIAGINAEAIDTIIEKNLCICGRKVGQNEKELLCDLKQYLPPHDHRVLVHGFKERYLEKLNNIEEVETEKQQIVDSYFDKEEKKQTTFEEIKSIDRKLTQITDISHLHLSKQEKQRTYDDKNKTIGILEHQNTELKNKLEKIDNDISLYTKYTNENQKHQESIEYANDLIKILDTTIEKKKSDIHKKLNDEVNAVFSNASHKKSKEVVIDSNYNYKIRDKYTGSEALSEGESIITSLSLISAILKIAKEQAQTKKNELEATVEYPLILDAPFAKLDTAHISGIAPLLPKFADQVILFSIDQQFKGIVEESVKHVIGKQYEMTNDEDKKVFFKELGEE